MVFQPLFMFFFFFRSFFFFSLSRWTHSEMRMRFKSSLPISPPFLIAHTLLSREPQGACTLRGQNGANRPDQILINVGGLPSFFFISPSLHLQAPRSSPCIIRWLRTRLSCQTYTPNNNKQTVPNNNNGSRNQSPSQISITLWMLIPRAQASPIRYHSSLP